MFSSLTLLILSSLLSLGLLGFRIFLTKNGTYFFLAWNLFLAWVPFLISLKVSSDWSTRFKKAKEIFLLGAWLAFFPNAAYILTDFFHLGTKTGIPLWFDLILISSFAWNGLVLGYFSLLKVQNVMEQITNRWVSWLAVTFCLFLGSYGIYLGRFERWNSWEVLTEPTLLFGQIAHHILNPLQYKQMVGMTFFFGLFLMMGYLTFFHLAYHKPFSKTS